VGSNPPCRFEIAESAEVMKKYNFSSAFFAISAFKFWQFNLLRSKFRQGKTRKKSRGPHRRGPRVFYIALMLTEYGTSPPNKSSTGCHS
jgi:hypothetical protein